jgi:hypothetical protein
LGQLHFVGWHPIFVGPQYGTCFKSPFWRLKVWGGAQNFGKFVHSYATCQASAFM